jgi:hypothetical protein
VPIILNVALPAQHAEAHRCPSSARRWRARSRALPLAASRMASGGLSHFVLDEEFDRTVMAAMKAGDEEALSQLPENVFKVGTAEIKNWYPVIAAMNAAGLKYHEVDYVPCYRSEAGTGNGMCFAYWQ